jgi:hypothetical protein
MKHPRSIYCIDALDFIQTSLSISAVSCKQFYPVIQSDKNNMLAPTPLRIFQSEEMKLSARCVVWFRAVFALIASQYWNTVGQYEGNRMLYWFVDGVIAFTQPPPLLLRPTPSTSGPAPSCVFLAFLSLQGLTPSPPCLL